MLQVSSQIKLFFIQTAKTGSGIWPASQSFGTRGSVPGNKAKADHFFPFSLEAKNEWSYTSISRICLHREYRHNFYNFNIAVLKTSDGQKSVLSFPVAATALFLLESLLFTGYKVPFRRQGWREGRMLVCDSDHSCQSSAKSKNIWRCTSSPPYVIPVWSLIQHSNNSMFVEGSF